MIYLFIGEDEASKQAKIQALKKQLFETSVESFNCETLYAKELSMATLGEPFSRLPMASKNRLLVIRDITKLKENLKGPLLDQLESLSKYFVVVLDVSTFTKGDAFLGKISKIAKVVTSKTEAKKDVFALTRAIEGKQVDSALNLLADLLKAGEKPEKIIGALRYIFTHSLQINSRIKKIDQLLEADIRIKTGRLKPEFALENLIVRLSAFAENPGHARD